MARSNKQPPGRVRDAILKVLGDSSSPLPVSSIVEAVHREIGETPVSSIRSYLRLNTPELFVREARGIYRAKSVQASPAQKFLALVEHQEQPFRFARSTLYHNDCLAWLDQQPSNSVHAVVTDPPYGMYEYSYEQQQKLRVGKGGVWRLPPSFDGHRRSPLPRFTTLNEKQIEYIRQFFLVWGQMILPVLVPGANVVVASNPLVSHIVATALSAAGLERRGEIIRLTMTMRGGDRPKGAHDEFQDVSVMPRSMWEPWLVFRKPPEGRVQDNLRRWKTGGFRRPEATKPFGDVIPSAPTRRTEKELAPHPSLKPQAFVRTLVRGVLPLGEGVVLDTFAGSGSTLAASNVMGYESIGIEKDRDYFLSAVDAIPKLTAYEPGGSAKPYRPSFRVVS